MTKHHILASAALLALALGSCGGSGGGGNVAMERGEWETTVQITNLRVDNLPPFIRDDMRRMPGNGTQTTRGCWPMTAAVVRIEELRFSPPELDRPGPECHIPELVMEGGRLRGRMRCTGLPGPGMERGSSMTVSGELDGSYTATSLQANASGEVRFGVQSGSADVRITSRRLGACPSRPRYVPPPYVPSPDMPESNMPMVAPAPVPMPPPPPRIVPPPGSTRPGNGM